jgi:hypothetical protein
MEDEKPKKNPGGRDTKYKKRYDQDLINHMSKGYTFESFAGTIDVCFDTLYEWAKPTVQASFSEAKKKGEAKRLMFLERLGVLAIGGKIPNFKETTYIFTMKNGFRKIYSDNNFDANDLIIKIAYDPKNP